MCLIFISMLSHLSLNQWLPRHKWSCGEGCHHVILQTSSYEEIHPVIWRKINFNIYISWPSFFFIYFLGKVMNYFSINHLWVGWHVDRMLVWCSKVKAKQGKNSMIGKYFTPLLSCKHRQLYSYRKVNQLRPRQKFWKINLHKSSNHSQIAFMIE